MDVVTGRHPRFPIDLQAQLCILLIESNRKSIIKESISPNRFRYIVELNKIGVNSDHASDVFTSKVFSP
jgi:UDP-N-acetylglucosamine enolpyruvyl transferase